MVYTNDERDNMDTATALLNIERLVAAKELAKSAMGDPQGKIGLYELIKVSVAIEMAIDALKNEITKN